MKFYTACPRCKVEGTFIRDRGFKDGSGRVRMCINPRCNTYGLYYYERKMKPINRLIVTLVRIECFLEWHRDNICRAIMLLLILGMLVIGHIKDPRAYINAALIAFVWAGAELIFGGLSRK